MRIIVYFISCIIFLECLDQQPFAFKFELVPFSIGKLLFMIVGFYNFRKARPNSMIVCFCILSFCIIAASFFNVNPSENLSRSVGSFLLILASIGWSQLWYKDQYKRILNVFLIVNFLYWSFYIMSVVNFTGSMVSYGEMYSNYNVINHHVCGLSVSLSSIFILVRYFIKENNFSLIGYAFILITLLILVLSESRSNLLVYSLMILFVVKFVLNIAVKAVFIVGFITVIFHSIFSNVSDGQDRLQQRFSMDRDFQSATNETRIEIYKRFPKEFIKYPLGKGSINGSKMDYDSQTNPHNQFLSFSLQGGMLAFMCVLFCWGKIVSFVRKLTPFSSHVDSYFHAIFTLLICYCVTLLTIDQGGLWFYIILSLLFFAFDSRNKTRYLR